MKHRRPILLVLVLVLVLGGLGWVLFAPHGPPEPVYKGKKLSKWLAGYDDYNHTTVNAAGMAVANYNTKPIQQADEAMREMGTNAIPTLLQMLRARDSGLKRKLMATEQKQHVIKIGIVSAAARNYGASIGFERLGSRASNAVPALVQICNENISKDSRINTMVALGVIHARPELAVPVLVQCTKDPEMNVRFIAPWALGHFGEDAKPAIPALLELWKDTTIGMRQSVGDAMRKIDPENADRMLAEQDLANK